MKRGELGAFECEKTNEAIQEKKPVIGANRATWSEQSRRVL
jgi:hypothetical protein